MKKVDLIPSDDFFQGATMKAKMLNFRRRLLAAAALAALVWAVDPTASPTAQDPYGRTGASIEAAQAPAVAARRAKLMEIHKDSVIVIPSQYKARSGALTDNLNFYYLTGLKEADATLVLDPSGSPRETIFRRSFAAPPAQTSAGRAVQSQAQVAAGPEKGLVDKPNTQLASILLGLMRSGRASRVFLPFSDFDFLSRTFSSMNPLAQAEAIYNIDPTLAEMRLTKDADEITTLREAIALTAEALNEAYRAAEPGVREIDLAAILRFAFNRHETVDSFLQVASGPNSTNVHFGVTTRVLAAGDLVVFDVGTWIRGYTSDISRTIPANGKFTKEQREIYALVLEAQKHGCRRLVPGVTFKTVQTEVEDILMAGLEKLGLVTDVKSPWQRQLYIQHGFGHGIGLEVHDVWSWHSPRLDQVKMAPGMVMTMEPGLYFPEARFDAVLNRLQDKVPDAGIAAFREKIGPVYKKYVGMGVRIEDDVLITEGGNEMLSGRVPKEIGDIEKMMREKSAHNLLK
jgi:Xaa-Pro aminopeptidase